jgi:L-aspartate oxidase
MPEQLISASIVAALPIRSFDAIVIGAGVAGLTFALHLPTDRSILLLTKGDLGESNTRYAQGGISAAIGGDDSPRLHEADTIAAGAGLCDPDTVRALVDGAPLAVDWLVGIGAQFDRDAGGSILLGREAAHSRRRVLHAGGDATGHEVERALVAAALERPNIEVWQHASAIDLVASDTGVTGAVIENEAGERWHGRASATVIAAGGAGQIWETTSNPSGATADGLAMAIRAGVAVADCEFVQFHPTVLALDGWEAFLVSEAVRGEGAFLRDDDGDRFMIEQHPLAELAPRDVVARGIHRQLVSDQGAFLDVRHLESDAIRERFPTIARELAQRGLDLATDLIPVSPAAHYFMGGVIAGADGRTSHTGLLALGEAACTGIHGANRLASNSLLEGLVFGRIAAEQASIDYPTTAQRDADALETGSPAPPERNPAVTQSIRTRIKQVMSAWVGVDRTADGLRTAITALDAIAAEAASLGRSRAEMTVLNMLTAAQAIAGAALHREESRGGHYRSDFPETDPALDGCHSLHGPAEQSWRFGSLTSVLTHPSTHLDPAYIEAMQQLLDRSDYDKGIITNPFGFDDAAGERGLARTRGVVEELGNPLQNLPVVHIAGSKGKGSTTTFLSSMLTAGGYRTGRYTSPHLHSFRERIAVDDEPISEADFARAFNRALAAAERLEAKRPELGRVTAFELVTAAALDHFAHVECDVAVIETGLGGRWDASNIVDPLVSVITLIDLEHTEILGDTLEQIAREKAGIIKPSRPVVTLDQSPDVLDLFRAVCTQRHADLAIEGSAWTWSGDWQHAVFTDDAGTIGPVSLGLHGEHQIRNAALALAALRRLSAFPVGDEAIVSGLASAWLPGRYEVIPATAPNAPEYVIDGAHSPASARALAATLQRDYASFDKNEVGIVFSMLKGKNAEDFIAELAPITADVVVTAIDSPRAMPVDQLEQAALAAGARGTRSTNVMQAIDTLIGRGKRVIVITGSLALAAEARVALGVGEQEVIPAASENR